MILLLMGFASLLWLAQDSAYPVASWIIGTALIIIASRLVWATRLDRARPALILFCLYFIFFYLLPGFVHVKSGTFPFYGLLYSESTVNTAAWVVFVFIGVFFATYNFKIFRVRCLVSSSGNVSRNSARYRQISVACGVSAIVLAVYIGWGSILIPRGEQQGSSDPAALVVVTLTRVLGFYCFLWALLAGGFKRWWIYVLAALALFILTNYPIAIPRFVLAAYVFAIFFIFVNFNRKAAAWFSCSLIALQFTIFPAVSALSRGDVRDLIAIGPYRNFSTSGDFDGMQSTINVVEYVSGAGFQWGRNITSAALFFIPRSLWSNKSPGTGADSASYVGYDYVNISAPLPAETYVDFGFAGVVFGAIAFGILLRYLDDQYIAAKKRHDLPRLVTICVTLGYLFIVMRGALVAVVGPVVITAGLALLFDRLIIRFKVARDS